MTVEITEESERGGSSVDIGDKAIDEWILTGQLASANFCFVVATDHKRVQRKS